MQMSTPQAEQGMLEHIAFEDDPNKRLEWQMMLRSVLESEVLSSETKRITSVDASVPAPSEFMYEIWFKMRAMHFGNAEGRYNTDIQRKVLQEIQQQVMPTLIEDITRARDFGAVSPSSERRRTPGEAPPTAAAGDAEDDNLTRASPEQRAEAMREVAALLARVDQAAHGASAPVRLPGLDLDARYRVTLPEPWPARAARHQAQHVRQREQSGFLGNARVEHDLEQQVAELVAYVVRVASRDRVGDLVCFLDRVRRDRLERLRAIPLAAMLRVPEASHDRHQSLNHANPPAITIIYIM